MKISKTTLAVIILAICFSNSYADGPGWTAASEVKNLVVVYTGGINVQLSPELSGCTSQSGYGQHHASIYPDHPGLNAMQSTLLAAKLGGKKVLLYLGDNTCKVLEMILTD